MSDTETKSILTRDAIVAIDDCEKVRVAVPEWGGDVYVRVMSGVQLSKVQEFKGKNDLDTLVHILTICLCDESGKSLFKRDDVKLLEGKSGVVLVRLANLAMSINGIGDDAEEELGKNSEAALGDASGSS